MAKRSIGVTIGGVVLSLQSAGFLLLASRLLLLPVVGRDAGVDSVKFPALIQGASVLGASCFLTTVAAIGLFRLRPWARVLVVLMSLWGILTSCVLIVMGFTVPRLHFESQAGPQPTGWAAAAPILLIGIPWMTVSSWWLYLLNKPSVKLQFESGQLRSGKTGRPLSITVIAMFMFLAPLGLTQVWRQPASVSWLLGFHVPLWIFRSYMLLSIALSVLLGIGLWRLKPWARRGAIGYLTFCVLNILLSLRMPIPSISELSELPGGTSLNAAQLQQMVNSMWSTIMIGAVISCLLQMWFLVNKRKNFERATENA